MHDVLRVLAERARAGSQPGERDDGFLVALAIEGGGMRGTISAGMALALDELGLVPAFDAVCRHSDHTRLFNPTFHSARSRWPSASDIAATSIS